MLLVESDASGLLTGSSWAELRAAQLGVMAQESDVSIGSARGTAISELSWQPKENE